MLDPAHYEGREQALVKHTFLDRYMANQLPKVARFGSFVYVDLFAGPWQSKAGDYSDTSFGIALRQMTAAKDTQARLGRDVRMIAHLVGKKDELEAATAGFPAIEIHCHDGLAEEHAPRIAAAIPKGSFRFVVIDPKGLPDIRDFASLITAPQCEVLVNFMFQFANRFVATDRMPRLIQWLSEVAPGTDWRARVDRLSSVHRERFVTNMARDALARMGSWAFAPVVTVDETASDRPLYKLIFLSRHELGLRLFRDAQLTALEVQSQQRTKVKLAKREARTGMVDMLAGLGDPDLNERSARLIQEGRASGRHYALEAIKDAGTEGIGWKKLWTEVLDAWVITYRDLSDAVAEWHKEGLILMPDLPDRARKPKDDHRIMTA